MAMVTIPGGICIPRAPVGGGGNAQTTQTPIDADADGAGLVFIAPKTGSIREMAFATQTVTTGGDLDCRLETVGATDGLPTGTLFGTDTRQTKTVDGADDNAWLTSGDFVADASVTKGISKIAMIVQRPASGAFSGNIKTHNNSWFLLNNPYGVWKPAASWTKGGSVYQPMMAIKYSDGVWVPILGQHVFQLMTTLTIGTGTSPDEVGNVFQLPFKYRVTGCWVWVDCDTAGNSFTVAFYDDSGTAAYSAALTEVSVDGDQLSLPTNGYVQILPFEDDIEVAANTVRRLVIRPTTATTMVAYRQDYLSSTYLALEEGGDDIYYTSRTNDGGTFSDSTSQRCVCGLVIDQIDDGAGAGGGGLLRHPGMQGGIVA